MSTMHTERRGCGLKAAFSLKPTPYPVGTPCMRSPLRLELEISNKFGSLQPFVQCRKLNSWV
ncbi:MAG: hypothetical protein PUP92_39535 [Rhizonema sp. PD38]|nr:hypothetical protein [Rhizonema sp. PD38]